jgi:DNA-binding transcriptional MerR regulator
MIYSHQRILEVSFLNTQLQISEVAKRASVSIRTIRFYEEKGLLQPSSFTSGGIRLYTARDINRLVFIRRMVTLGMTLEDIRLCLGQITDEQHRKERARRTVELLHMQKEKLNEERAKIDQLKKDIEESEMKITQCLGCSAEICPEQCPSFGQIL